MDKYIVKVKDENGNWIGVDAIQGVTFIPHMEQISPSEVKIFWTNDGGLDNPNPVTLKVQ